jgi:ElaB/YqjD/DUF883 family membrane-anchored ribosome-binding protein
MATTADRLIRRTRRAAKDHGLDLATVSKQLDKVFRNARRSAGSAASSGITATNRYVHRNPWTAVALAAGAVALAGIAVATVMSQRRSHRFWRL